ncbi:hypothetical protein D3C85_1317520 [compost metagenome]
MICFVLLAGGQRTAQSGQRRLLGQRCVNLELCPLVCDGDCIDACDPFGKVLCSDAVKVHGKRRYLGDVTLDICNPSVFSFLPFVQRLAHFFLPCLKCVPHALALGVYALRDFFLLCRQLLAHGIQRRFGLGDFMRH